MSNASKPGVRTSLLLSRRTVLAAALAGASGLAATGSLFSLAQAASVDGGSPIGFMAVSRLLTGHTLDDSLADRAWKAIAQANPQFPERFDALVSAIQKTGLSDMSQWASSPLAGDSDVKATALAIISAWYLGRVGEMKERETDGPVFITYAGALMWRPTLDVTVIPTYSRGKPGFWKDKPEPSR